MSLRDYYIPLSRRVITQTSDSAGGFTETTADTTFYGYIAELNGQEILNNQQLGNNATSELFTETVLNLVDRIVDGVIEYEVVWVFQKFHLRYLLKRVK
jgi:hypothetical protein